LSDADAHSEFSLARREADHAFSESSTLSCVAQPLIRSIFSAGPSSSDSLSEVFLHCFFWSPKLPEYVSVGLVDDAQISHCDSITNRNVPKQDWMDKATVEDPQYWDRQTETCL
ncbi:hypothetical protein INR49_003428, partial [Caranx melampygus]